jgi:hypothetical protein
LGEKTNVSNQRLKEMSSQIAQSLYATQAKIAQMKKGKGKNFISSENAELNANHEIVLKYQKDSCSSKKSLENSKKSKTCKKKKMSEDTYIESKSSMTNIIQKKRKSLMSKKWRREVKQQINNANLFKRSKEKKLDFSINDSSSASNKNIYSGEHHLDSSPVQSSISKIRNEMIQDDSDDEKFREEKKNSSIYLSNRSMGKIKVNSDIEKSSQDSDPLQKIIEQRMMESSTDSEESEEELDDDYDIGIDDIDLGTDDLDEIHTATEDGDS